MEVNADFSQRVVLDTNALDWIPSPLPGVDRRMLDRIGDEVARATSIVRYAPGSSFSAHTHSGGEEFLVLDGVFSDEHGDYGPGFYVRNPVGSAHTPSSAAGCTILVKLWQMDPEDQTFVRTDTRNGDWQETDAAGVEKLALHSFGPEEVMMFRLAPGASVPRHGHVGGEEILVLEGELDDEHGRYSAGSWLRSPPGTKLAPFSDTGCLIYVKLGHLAEVRGLDIAG
ncbi:MAG: cupin domain-containing protein [Rhodospirillaceae bacterium]